MLNPKDTENFYMQTTPESYKRDLGFTPDSILDTPSEELDGIEVLVQMAKQGKIDPWNIDIADIADKYMLHIAESKSNNLRVTGRALFFLAVLLKLKSNVLVGIDPMQFEIQEEFNPEYDDDDSRFNEDLYYQDFPDNVIPIEDIIQRRTSVKLNRNRIVTLKDLIRQLEFYEQIEKKQQIQSQIERAQQRRVRSYKNMSADDIINMAHEEYIESSIKILHENLVKIFEKEEKVELNTLTLLGLDKISAYMALLFLTVDSEFDLEQDEFYSDLYVVKGKAPEQRLEEEQTA
ncbi:segregation/condensation protein A [bacterium]|nr:segregation/condensation protein A [bacterium]